MAIKFPFSRKPKVVYGTDEDIKKELVNAIINFPKINFDTDDGGKIVSLIICSKILSQDIARLPIKLYKTDEKGNKVILRDDPRNIALHFRPNPYQDVYSFKNSLEFTRSSEGNSYARIRRDVGKNRIYLDVIPENKVSGPVLVNDELYYEIDGEKEPVNGADILHFKNLSINGYKGRSPQDDLNLNLGISFKALMTLDKFFENGGLPSVMIESLIPEGVDPVEWRNMYSEFEAKYSSYVNNYKVWFLAPFTKATTISVDFKNAQLIETMKFNNAMVASYYGIPPHKLGLIENSKFNSLVELQDDYVNNTIAPILEMYRREFELKLLTEEEIINGYSIEFETNALYITDVKTRWEIYKNAFSIGVMGSEDISRLENSPITDSKKYIATGFMSIDKANLPKGTIPTKDGASGASEESA